MQVSALTPQYRTPNGKAKLEHAEPQRRHGSAEARSTKNHAPSPSSAGKRRGDTVLEGAPFEAGAVDGRFGGGAGSHLHGIAGNIRQLDNGAFGQKLRQRVMAGEQHAAAVEA